MRFPSVLIAGVSLILGVSSSVWPAQNNVASSTSTDEALDTLRLVVTGEIRKIDTKKKNFEVKVTVDNGPAGYRQQPRSAPPRGGMGRRGGMGGRRGGMGYPPPNQPQTSTIDVKVFATEQTVLKDHERNVPITFDTLKNGVHVTVTAVHRGTGHDVDALQISRTVY